MVSRGYGWLTHDQWLMMVNHWCWWLLAGGVTNYEWCHVMSRMLYMDSFAESVGAQLKSSETRVGTERVEWIILSKDLGHFGIVTKQRKATVYEWKSQAAKGGSQSSPEMGRWQRKLVNNSVCFRGLLLKDYKVLACNHCWLQWITPSLFVWIFHEVSVVWNSLK